MRYTYTYSPEPKLLSSPSPCAEKNQTCHISSRSVQQPQSTTKCTYSCLDNIYTCNNTLHQPLCMEKVQILVTSVYGLIVAMLKMVLPLTATQLYGLIVAILKMVLPLTATQLFYNSEALGHHNCSTFRTVEVSRWKHIKWVKKSQVGRARFEDQQVTMPTTQESKEHTPIHGSNCIHRGRCVKVLV